MDILGGVFPYLFLLGKGIPTGNVGAKHWKHYCLYYDGRFNDAMFIAHGFNQLQRHACIRRTAKITVGQKKKLESLSILANSIEFRERLMRARDDPFTYDSKVLNSKLTRALSLVGSSVPYSPFERAGTRSKMLAHRYRYGMASFFTTGSPPEFEDLTVLRRCCIKKWNDPMCVLSGQEFTRDLLPEDVRSSTSLRLRLTKQKPLWCADAFHKKLTALLETVIGCPSSTRTRRTYDYAYRPRLAFGYISSVNGVIEPQADGRLHWHINLFSSILTPSVLPFLAAAPKTIRRKTSELIDSIVTTSNPHEVYEWYERESSKNIRAADISVPNAEHYDDFLMIARQKAVINGIHSHGFTCQKLPKGRYQCRLSMPRGVHNKSTRPIHVQLLSDSDKNNGKRAEFHASYVQKGLKKILIEPLDIMAGSLCRKHVKGPILWEQHRDDKDKYFVEQNLLITALIQCHNNASFISGMDAGEAVEEYLISYFEKESASLKQAAGVLLAALEHIQAHPSIAPDRHSLSRNATHLAQRTVNSFCGSHQWSLPLMASALLGHRSHITSDTYRYIFPHDNVTYNDANIGKEEKIIGERASADVHLTEQTTFVEDCLDALIATSENIGEISDSFGGTTTYHIKRSDKVIFMTQAESYVHRGPWFEAMNPLEFECIVELKPIVENDNENLLQRRPKRPGFNLGVKHPLVDSHHGFIRMKMLTPILAGKPPPSFPGNRPINTVSDRCLWEKRMNVFAKYMIDLLVPWNETNQRFYSRDANGLSRMVYDWNSCDASLINRQRYQYFANVMNKCYRSSYNEKVVSAWRDRNCDRWCDLRHNSNVLESPEQAKKKGFSDLDDDNEHDGVLNAEEIYHLTATMTKPNIARKSALKAAEQIYSTLFDYKGEKRLIGTSQIASYIHVCNQNELSLGEMRKRIHSMYSTAHEVKDVFQNSENTHLEANVNDANLPSTRTESSAVMCESLSSEQRRVLDKMLNAKEQQLIFMHGGGGTGKTHVTCCIVSAFQERGQVCCCSCPTGVGASLLPQGRTFHSIFRTWKKSINAGKIADEIFSELGGNMLKVIMIDEVSMLSSAFLVLLDERLRSLYDNTKIFGGISILLSGDFLQLPVMGGRDLWSIMYGPVTGSDSIARDLFRQFCVVEMTSQMRAAACKEHQSRLRDFRALPKLYPNQRQWSKSDFEGYKPITENIIAGLTKEITSDDILSDPRWVTDGTVLVTSNVDRAIINKAAAKLFALREHKHVIFWRRKLIKTISPTLQNLIYDADARPELFAFFVQGAPAQILDNGNGNVRYGVANGTSCKMMSLAWDDKDHEVAMMGLLNRHSSQEAIELPIPPDHIIVQITLSSQNTWPQHLNLTKNKGVVHIPIGLVSRHDSKKSSIKINRECSLSFMQHAVDLAFALTVWKAQGGTFSYIMALLEPSPGSIKLSYEMIYVMMSRVKEASKFRCLPLSLTFDKTTLTRLRPKIGAVKWRMDISDNGYWKQRDTAIMQQSGKRFVSLCKASPHSVRLEQASLVCKASPHSVRLEQASLARKVNNANICDISEVQRVHTVDAGWDEGGVLHLNGFKWKRNSCALDTICTTILFLMYRSSSTDRGTMQSCFVDGHYYLQYLQQLTSITSLQNQMVRVFYESDEPDGNYYSLQSVWDSIFVQNEQAIYCFGLTRIMQQVCSTCLETSSNCFVTYYFYPMCHDFQQFFSSTILHKENTDRCSTCSQHMVDINCSVTHIPLLLFVDCAGIQSNDNISTMVLVNNETYLLDSVCYYKSSHFTARFCTVIDRKISDTWYFYDGMRNNGKITRRSNGPLHFKFTDEEGSAQIIFYRRSNI